MLIKDMAVVFPGQGAQKPGMGLDFFENSDLAKEMFQKADEILGYSISELCFHGTPEQLVQTSITQPAIFMVSVVAYELLKQHGFEPAMTAGHSVGEYAALYAAGVLGFEEALRLVSLRGKLMQEAGVAAPGTMAAIIGLKLDAVKECCSKASATGVVEIANFNTPEQIVISGAINAVAKASELAKEAGAKKVVPLKVGAAFHSPLMQKPAATLAEELEKIEFKDPVFPVVMNYTGKVATTAVEIKENLKKQMLGSVLWVDIVREMIGTGIQSFIEVGPGKALSGMIKKIDLKTTTYNVEDLAGFEKIDAAFAK